MRRLLLHAPPTASRPTLTSRTRGPASCAISGATLVRRHLEAPPGGASFWPTLMCHSRAATLVRLLRGHFRNAFFGANPSPFFGATLGRHPRTIFVATFARARTPPLARCLVAPPQLSRGRSSRARPPVRRAGRRGSHPGTPSRERSGPGRTRHWLPGGVCLRSPAIPTLSLLRHISGIAKIAATWPGALCPALLACLSQELEAAISYPGWPAGADWAATSCAASRYACAPLEPGS